MTILLIRLLCVLLEADPAVDVGKSSLNSASGPTAVKAAAKVETEFQKLQADDDAAQAEVEKWKRENLELRARGAGLSDAELKARVGRRLELVRKAYLEFLALHPDHAQAHLTFGSFLADLEEELAAKSEWEKALELNPKLSIAYNNLAGFYTETGDVRKALDFFSKAIELSPGDASFHHNFGDSTYVLRKGVTQQFGLSEQQVFAKALQHYSNAVRLDPTNFLFASDWAQTYYAFDPIPFDAALSAWTNAFRIASTDGKRQLACVHLARVKMLAGRYVEARAQLVGVTDPECLVLKSNLLERIQERERQSLGTNALPTPSAKKP